MKSIDKSLNIRRNRILAACAANRHRDRRAPDIHERQHGAHHAAKRRLPRRHDRTDLATRQRLAQQRPCHGRNGGQGVRADPDQPQRRPEHGSSDDQLDPVQLCLSHHRRWHRAQHRRPHRRSEQPRVLHQGHAGRERHLRRRERPPSTSIASSRSTPPSSTRGRPLPSLPASTTRRRWRST